VTGGFIYRGNQSPGLRGTYLFADYCTGRLRALRREGGQWVSSVALEHGGQITTFGEDEDGEMYAADASNGSLFRIEGSSVPRIAASGIVNAASFAPGLVAGSLATLYATGLLDNPGVVSATSLPLSTTLAGVSVRVNGVAAPILAIANMNGSEQVNFQVPFEAAGRATASVTVSRAGGASAPVDATMFSVQPGLYDVVVHNADFTLVTAQHPLAPDEFAFVYAAGIGRVSNPPATGSAATASPLSMAVEEVRVTIAGISCEVQFAGLAPNFVGVYQVSFRAPASAPSGLQDLVVTAGGVTSPAIKVSVR
jgi:uncharacterized protein (TIGR03437 family)